MSSTSQAPVRRRVYIKNEAGEYVCPFCGVTKANQNTMFYHMNKHEGKLPHECSVCKKGFVQKQELQFHMLKWHPATGASAAAAQEEICCPYDNCTFSDIRKGNVRTHIMRKHVTKHIKDYISRDEAGQWLCDLCDAEFASAAGFYYHLYKCTQEHEILPAEDVARLAEL